MAEGQQRNVPVVRQAYKALDQFKYEVANEIGQNPNDPQAQLLQQWAQGAFGGYGGDIPSRLWGAVGGHMVRRMIAAAEQSLVGQATAAVQQGFRQTVGAGFPKEPDAQNNQSSAHNPAEARQTTWQ